MKKEIWGIIFFLIALVVGISLFSYHPADPLFWLKSGRAGEAHNLFGTVGAHLAGGIFFLLGFSSFWLVAIFLSMAFLSFRGHTFSSPQKSILASLFLIFSFSGILGLQTPGAIIYRGSEVISGGFAGVHIAQFMRGFLNYFGAYVLLAAVFVISLMVCTHISFGWVLSRFSLWSAGIVRRLRELSLKKKERRRKKRVREETIKKERVKPKPKVTIVEPVVESPKQPEQESFPFMTLAGKFKLPSLDLLNEQPADTEAEIQRESLEMNARRVERKLADFGVDGEVVEILPGPVITMYEFKPAPGVKISKVAGLSDDLALALRAPSIRIVAPIPGKAAIGIEIPNNKRQLVFLHEILSSQAYKNSTYRLTIGLGKDITGAPVISDLTKMPHLLVAGATGTGKSVSLNAMLNSLLFKFSPDVVRFLIIDPKRIELTVYNDIPHLLYPVVTEPKEATKALRWAVQEMERRYNLLSDRGVRNIEAYNRKVMKGEKTKRAPSPEETEKQLPYIVVVIDELSDLMMTSSREVEEAITRLAQMARAAGIHLIIATQRPSVDVLTGIIKANFPARISFQVSSRVDSRTILDTIGAENLLGDGDLLFLPPGVGRITRIHGAFIAEDEVKRVTDFLREQMKPDYDFTLLNHVAQEEETFEDDIEFDEKYESAVDLVMQTGQASISMIQRKLRVGYNRAARMIEAMEKQGIVGPSDGVRPREVFRRIDE
ncbi:MAG: DNA translocase FtsK 4TM domain-containing protein [Deltaproteobacteria bacterium]|nr:MAG: DNA translocase FtsK 4TM domain-containing protein [Deltaproteobacteria bacterium]